MEAYKYLVGIDEAGRGPLAGPVSVGAVALMPEFDTNLLRGVRDSKQLSEDEREVWYARMRRWQKAGTLRCAVAYAPAATIDRRGIVFSVSSALSRAITQLAVSPRDSLVLLDGGLRAPTQYCYQETICGGDASEPVIALASIAAKVRRDRLMKRFASTYAHYGFEVHKGYGTPFHREKIRSLGLCDIHRKSFWHG